MMKHKQGYFLIIVICLKFVCTVSKAVITNEIENEFSQGGSEVLEREDNIPINFDDLNKKLNEASSGANWNDQTFNFPSIPEDVYKDITNNKKQLDYDPSWNNDFLESIRNQPSITLPPYNGLYEDFAKQAEEENESNRIVFSSRFQWYPIFIILGIVIFVIKLCLLLAYRRRRVIILTRATIYSPTTTTLPPSQTHLPSQTEELSQTDNPPSYDDVVNVPQNVPLVQK